MIIKNEYEVDGWKGKEGPIIYIFIKANLQKGTTKNPWIILFEKWTDLNQLWSYNFL